MSDNDKKETNVTSFADFRKKKDEEPSVASSENSQTAASADSDTYFADMKKANEEKKRLMDIEREKANKGVIRSYKLK